MTDLLFRSVWQVPAGPLISRLRSRKGNILAITDPDPGPVDKLRLILLTLAKPEAAAKESVKMFDLPGKDSCSQMLANIKAVRRGFIRAFIWVAPIFFLGLFVGHAGFRVFGPSDNAVFFLGSVGALFFFWATLGLRGWEIETMEGSSLPERINQWIFKALYLFGTLLVMASAGWGIGPI